MINKFNNLIGYEGSVIDLSNELMQLDCEDICYFGNCEEFLRDGNVVVSIDEEGEKQIQIFFDVIYSASKDEVTQATIIKITKIDMFA